MSHVSSSSIPPRGGDGISYFSSQEKAGVGVEWGEDNGGQRPETITKREERASATVSAQQRLFLERQVGVLAHPRLGQT